MISSSKNPKIKELAQLRESRSRRETGLFLIEGARELGRALEAGYVCRTLYVAEDLLSKEGAEIADSLPRSLRFEVSKEVFARAAVRENSDGLLAVMEQRIWSFADLGTRSEPFLLVLENVEKPGNYGALARSADGVGVDAIIVLDPKADLYNPNAVRTSVGAIFSRPLIAVSHEAFLEFCKARGLRIVTASPFATQFHFEAELRGALALVLGSEAWGLSDAWKTVESVKIPMNGIADSLNVSVAGAVLMYEALRQRR